MARLDNRNLGLVPHRKLGDSLRMTAVLLSQLDVGERSHSQILDQFFALLTTNIRRARCSHLPYCSFPLRPPPPLIMTDAVTVSTSVMDEDLS